MGDLCAEPPKLSFHSTLSRPGQACVKGFRPSFPGRPLSLTASPGADPERSSVCVVPQFPHSNVREGVKTLGDVLGILGWVK